MMPKLKMFGWNLFVQSSSKVVRVLKVRHPPGHLSSLSPLHLWSPTWSTTRLRRWYSALKFSASFPLVHCCSRLSVRIIPRLKIERDNDRCKYMQNNYTPNTIYIIVIVLINQTNHHFICPNNRSTRDCQGSSLESSTTRRKHWTREKSAPFCHQL